MDKQLKFLFDAVAAGRMSPKEAASQAEQALANRSVEDLGFAHVDHDRTARCGFAEVIFAQGKTPEQVVRITHALFQSNPVVLITRASEATAQAVLSEWPNADHNPTARTVVVGPPPPPADGTGTVLVVAAGTSDLPVAEEARVTIAAMGCRVELVCDVGVAGLHRLLAHQDQLQAAAALVVVAGMEGALPSVVGGLVAAPVVAVPTSVGYGASFQGIAALLGMLNSCAAGVSVVNIDNGFGGGYVAARIALAHVGPDAGA